MITSSDELRSKILAILNEFPEEIRDDYIITFKRFCENIELKVEDTEEEYPEYADKYKCFMLYGWLSGIQSTTIHNNYYRSIVEQRDSLLSMCERNTGALNRICTVVDIKNKTIIVLKNAIFLLVLLLIILLARS